MVSTRTLPSFRAGIRLALPQPCVQEVKLCGDGARWQTRGGRRSTWIGRRYVCSGNRNRLHRTLQRRSRLNVDVIHHVQSRRASRSLVRWTAPHRCEAPVFGDLLTRTRRERPPCGVGGGAFSVPACVASKGMRTCAKPLKPVAAVRHGPFRSFPVRPRRVPRYVRDRSCSVACRRPESSVASPELLGFGSPPR
jgi:hypothetical protein